MQEVNYFDSPTFVAVRKNLAWKRLAQDGNLTPLDPSDPPPEMYAVLNYFDYIGLLQERGYLDEDDVWESFGYWIDFYYADSIQVIAEERKKESKNDYKKFEALAKKMQFLDDRKGEEPGVPPPKRIADFYSYEKDQPIGEPPQPWPTLQKNRTSGRSKSK